MTIISYWQKISVERITIEFVKLLLGAHRNSALKAFVATECYLYCPGLKQAGEALLGEWLIYRRDH